MSAAVSMSSRAVVAALVALVAREAAAAEPAGARDPVTEVGHEVRVRFDRGHATMVVRRSVHNTGRRYAEAVLGVAWTGAITGLRIRGRDGWHHGRLHIDADAEEHYADLARVVDAAPVDRAAALLGMVGQEAALSLFPLAGGSTRTVEYDLEVPATWSAGRWWIGLDAFADHGVDVQVEAVDPRDRLALHRYDWEAEAEHERAIAQGERVVAAEESAISLRPREAPAVTLELAADSTGSGRAYAFWRLSLGRLSRLPAHARVVVAIDASRSLADGVPEAQRQAAMAYLWGLREPGLGVKVTVLAFDRRVRTIGEAWMSVDEAISTLRRARFTVGNGSDVDLALRRAGALLDRAPAGAPRRVLVLSDLATASARRAEEHREAATSTGAIVHLAAIADRGPRLRRDDEHAWSAAAAATRGVVWAAATPSEPDRADRDETRALLREWARPLRLDDVHVELDELPFTDLPLAERTLAEREGAEGYLFTPRPALSVTVRGRLWNTPVVHTVRQDLEMSRRWAGFMVNGELELEVAEQRHLGLRSGAVGPATSYLAIEPGARPSRAAADLEEYSDGLAGKGGGGGSGSGYGRSSGSGFGGRIDRGAWFANELAYLWRGCGGGEESVTVALETTFEELVDVAVREVHPLASCLEEAAWELWLPAGEFVDPRVRWEITL